LQSQSQRSHRQRTHALLVLLLAAGVGSGLGASSCGVDSGDAGTRSGQVVYRALHLPCGDSLPADTNDLTHEVDYSFTGQEHDADLAAFDFGARFQDPRLCRFTSLDPALDDEANGRSLYTYVANNPMNRVDPAGEMGMPFGFMQGTAATQPNGSQDRKAQSSLGLQMVNQLNDKQQAALGKLLLSAQPGQELGFGIVHAWKVNTIFRGRTDNSVSGGVAFGLGLQFLPNRVVAVSRSTENNSAEPQFKEVKVGYAGLSRTDFGYGATLSVLPNDPSHVEVEFDLIGSITPLKKGLNGLVRLGSLRPSVRLITGIQFIGDVQAFVGAQSRFDFSLGKRNVSFGFGTVLQRNFTTKRPDFKGKQVYKVDLEFGL